jgi:hypothetical protein
MPHHLDGLAKQEAPFANPQDWKHSIGWPGEMAGQAVPLVDSDTRVRRRQRANAPKIRYAAGVADAIRSSLSLRLPHRSDYGDRPTSSREMPGTGSRLAKARAIAFFSSCSADPGSTGRCQSALGSVIPSAFKAVGMSAVP